MLPSKNAINTWNIQYVGTSNLENYFQAEKKSDEKIVNNKYAVFCDENLCQHIEAELAGVRWVENEEKYYADCNKLFERIEKEFGIDVVVALHPSLVHNEKASKFNSQQQIVGKTIELIRNAEFVILYGSTSVDFAILYEKPVLYYTSHDLEKCNQNLIKGHFVRNYKEYLSARYLFIDCIDEYKNIRDYICYDEKLYGKYKDTYIMSSPNIKEGYSDAIFRWIRNYK